MPTLNPITQAERTKFEAIDSSLRSAFSTFDTQFNLLDPAHPDVEGGLAAIEVAYEAVEAAINQNTSALADRGTIKRHVRFAVAYTVSAIQGGSFMEEGGMTLLDYVRDELRQASVAAYAAVIGVLPVL